MNKKNLTRIKHFLPTIDPKKFNMKRFRPHEMDKSIECKTVGCVIGHAVVLDKENVYKNYINPITGGIKFTTWMEDFLDLKDYRLFKFLFSGEWENYDNTIKGAIKRIDYILEDNDISNFKYENFKEGW